jgi:chromosome segregation ATPase
LAKLGHRFFSRRNCQHEDEANVGSDVSKKKTPSVAFRDFGENFIRNPNAVKDLEWSSPAACINVMEVAKATSSLAMSMSTLRGKHVRLLEVMQGLMSENSQLGDKVAELETNRGVQIDVDERQRIADAAREKSDAEMAQLHSVIAAKAVEISALQRKVEEMSKGAEAQAGKGKTESDEMLREFELSMKKQEDGEKAREKLMRALAAIEKEVTSVGSANEALKSEVAQQKELIESLRNDNNGLSAAVTKGEDDKAVLAERLAKLQRQIDSFRSNAEKGAEENKSFLERYQAEKLRLQNIADERQTRCVYLTEKMAEHANESAKLREELLALQRTLAEERALHPRSGSRFGDFIAIKNENVKLKRTVNEMDRKMQNGGGASQKVAGPSSSSYSLKNTAKNNPPLEQRDRGGVPRLAQPNVLRSITEPSGGDGGLNRGTRRRY